MVSKALVAASIKPFILSILAGGESYGYAIIEHVKQVTRGQIEWTTSTLYPVLHSLENDGLLNSRWEASPDGPRRKYYQLTPRGRKTMAREKQQWLSVHDALTELWSEGPSLKSA